MRKELRALIVEDSEDDTLLLTRELKRGGNDLSYERVETSEAMLKSLQENEWDIVISDYVMPHFSGLDALRILKETDLDLPFIIVSGAIGEDLAVGAMRAGAHDYVLKGNLARLIPAIERELREAAERREHCRADRALRESQELYEKLVLASPDAVTKTDLEGRVTYASLRTAELHGYGSSMDMIGLNTLDLIAPEYREEALKNLHKTLEEGISGEVEYEFLKRDGSRFIGTLSAVCIKNAEGEQEALIATTRDITQRKQVEEAVRISEEKYRHLFESSKEGIVVLGLEGRIIEANSAYLDMLGYTIGEIRGLTDERLTPKKWHQMETDILRDEVLKRGYSDEYEKENIRKDGSHFDVSVRRWLIQDVHGEPSGMWAIYRDITERKRCEEQLQVMNDELETYAHTVSHDLKGPLAVIKSTAQALESILDRPLDEDFETDLKEISHLLIKNADWSRSAWPRSMLEK
jgi:PAS domain S-box-containing protein